MSTPPTIHNPLANLSAVPTGPPQSTRFFFDNDWNFTIHYPSDWRIIYENEPIGSWIIPLAIAGPGSVKEQAVFMIGARCNTAWQSADELKANSTMPEAGSIESPRVLQEYIAKSKTELEQSLAGYKLISAETIDLAHRPTVWLVYSYNGKHGRVCEESYTLFGVKTMFWFVCRAPSTSYAQMRPCFQDILASFRIGREIAESR